MSLPTTWDLRQYLDPPEKDTPKIGSDHSDLELDAEGHLRRIVEAHEWFREVYFPLRASLVEEVIDDAAKWLKQQDKNRGESSKG